MASARAAEPGHSPPSAPVSPRTGPVHEPQTSIPEIQAPEPDPPLAALPRRVSFHSSISAQKSLMARRSSVQRQPSPAPSPRQLAAHDVDEEEEVNETSSMLNGDNGTVKRNYNTASGNDNGAPAESSSLRERRSSRVSSRQYQDSPSWFKRTLEKFGSVELENKGSVARDHLALERTYLAWLRTSLSFASIGIAITQLFRLNTSIKESALVDGKASQGGMDPSRLHHVGKPLGATFLGIGILVLLLGFHRYFESQHYVILGRFPASRASVIIVTLSAGALIISCLVVVLVKAPAS